jgi:hypothetical protein
LLFLKGKNGKISSYNFTKEDWLMCLVKTVAHFLQN